MDIFPWCAQAWHNNRPVAPAVLNLESADRRVIALLAAPLRRCTQAPPILRLRLFPMLGVTLVFHNLLKTHPRIPFSYDMYFSPRVILFPPGRTSFHGLARTRTTASRSTFTTAGLTLSTSRM